MSQLMKTIMPLLCAATVLSACGATGWGQKSSGSTHGLTGGAEAAPTAEATPQPARPRGDIQRESQGGPQGGSRGTGSPAGQTSPSSGSSSGDTTTGGAEGAPTRP